MAARKREERDTRSTNRRKFMRRSDFNVLLLFVFFVVVVIAWARSWFTFSFNGVFL